MYSLPQPPEFPVFGLDDRFDGPRWLVIWNDREHLYTVTLGHGHNAQWPGISVTTVRKTPERRTSDDVVRGPTGFQDAWFDATIVLGEYAFPKDRRAAAAVLHSTDDRHRVDVADRPEELGPEWAPVTVTVEGREHPAARREVGDACAYLVDLPQAAIAVNGPSNLAPAGLALTEQTHQLDRYR